MRPAPRLALLLPLGLGALSAWGQAPARPLAPSDPKQAVAYRDLIQPIFAARCVSCHGPKKAKGDLRLDSWAAVTHGGKDGDAIKPGDSAASELCERLRLGEDEDDHMPPSGKPQLTESEVSLIAWWIDAGAPERRTVADLKPSPEVLADLAVASGHALPAPPAPDRAKTLAAAASLAAKLGIVIRPLTPNGPWLEVDARLLLKKFGDQDLAALAPVAPAIERLDVGETSVTDSGLAPLAAMPALRQLKVDRTAITDAGLPRVAAAAALESLNLFGTAVSDAGLPALRPLRHLRKIYLWQTHVTPAGAAEFAAAMGDAKARRRAEAELAAAEDHVRAATLEYDLGLAADATMPAAKTASAMGAKPAAPLP